MKYQKFKYFRDRLYEVYFCLTRTAFYLVFTLADVDLEFHIVNFRNIMVDGVESSIDREKD